MNRKKLLIITGTILLIAIAITLWIIRGAVGTTNNSGESNMAAVEALPGSVSVKVEGPSIIEPYQTRNIKSAIEGFIVMVAREGDSVEKGGILVSLEGTDKERDTGQNGCPNGVRAFSLFRFRIVGSIAGCHHA